MRIKLYDIPNGEGEIAVLLPRGSTVLGVHGWQLVVHADHDSDATLPHYLLVVGAATDFSGIKAYRYLGCCSLEWISSPRYVFERLP